MSENREIPLAIIVDDSQRVISAAVPSLYPTMSQPTHQYPMASETAIRYPATTPLINSSTSTGRKPFWNKQRLMIVCGVAVVVIIMIILAVGLYQPPQSQQQQQHQQQTRSNQQKFMQLIASPMSNQEAFRTCKSLTYSGRNITGQLVTIKNLKDQLLVMDFQLNNSITWIGIVPVNLTYYLWDDTTPLDDGYTNWADGEPKGIDTCYALSISDGTWKGVSCDQPLPTICEFILIPNTRAPTTSPTPIPKYLEFFSESLNYNDADMFCKPKLVLRFKEN